MPSSAGTSHSHGALAYIQAKHSDIKKKKEKRKTKQERSQRLLAQALFGNFSQQVHFWKNSDTRGSSFHLALMLSAADHFMLPSYIP